MLYDLAENKTVTDWLCRRNGFAVGVGLGLVIVAVWLPVVFTQPQVATDDLFDMSMLLHFAVFGFIVVGMLWGLLFRLAAGVTWAFGVGLIVAISTGLVTGLDVTLGWGIDWGFGAKGFYTKIDVKPQGLGTGAFSGLVFGAAVGATTVVGSLAAMTATSLFLRRFVQGWMKRFAPGLVRHFPSGARRVIDPSFRFRVK